MRGSRRKWIHFEKMKSNSLTYADSGVNLQAADELVDRIKPYVRSTYGPRVLGKHGAFAGCFRLDYNERLFQHNYRDPVLVSCTDGVGSKVLLASKMGVLDTVGQDVVAMNVNDLVVQGAEPLFFLDYIGIHKIDPDQIAQIVKGIAEGCKLAGCALLGGESAELSGLYRAGDFDLVGMTVGVCELKKMVHGSRVEAGDVILGLSSSGIHSNGYSLVHHILRHAKLGLGKTYSELDESQTLGQVLLKPTRIYARQVIDVLHRYSVKQPIRAMSHITGGGLPGNIMRTLGSHLNARVNRKAWSVPPIFSFLQGHGQVSDDEMMRVFNMGIGYVCVVRPHFADSIAHQFRRAGEQVHILGKISRGTGRLVIV